ncbi:MAG: metal-sensing transcriptional repressor [Candidatus Eisenbacteria bacterium]|nr:metal-sensing transcriptional repressor [Candidatus Eisenbacteria bacterium]
MLCNRGHATTEEDESLPAHKTTHEENLARLARVEGQVRGIRTMVEEGAYCIDIVNQIQAAQSALGAIARRILRKHIDHCVSEALSCGSDEEATEKTEELMHVLERYMG